MKFQKLTGKPGFELAEYVKEYLSFSIFFDGRLEISAGTIVSFKSKAGFEIGSSSTDSD